ncbi:hypothetical protein BJF78_02620 [Pseudonocardia sp. CNS-139]|nr:hypothetical protein BJF78_02620 [Pseudonocardia sp. CNS-139]
MLWAGTLTLTGLAGALVMLGRGALLGESTRRSVNVVWDVVSFWPRAVHPFVPPAYSQRAVPDLETRIHWHLDRIPAGPGGPGVRDLVRRDPVRRDLVLCGHSQGSLLAFAALVRCARSGADADRVLLDRVGLLTLGSQLQVMFARAFPAYVNLRAIEALHRRLGGAWRNLYRDTDHLAGPVLSWQHTPATAAGWVGKSPGDTYADRDEAAGARREYGPDWRLLDPPLPDAAQQQRPLDALRGHGDYWGDAAWPAALAALRATPPAPARAPVAVPAEVPAGPGGAA